MTDVPAEPEPATPDGEVRLFAFDLPERLAPKLSAIGGQIAVALSCAAGAVLSREIVDLFMPGAGPFALTFPFVLFATLFARWGAGAATMIFCALYAWYFVLPGEGSFEFTNPSDGPRVVINVASGFAIVALAETYRRFSRRVVAERDMEVRNRQLYLDEFEHRVKNKFAMVAAMVRMEMRSVETDEAVAALRTVLGRVESIASAHAALYRGEDGISEVRMNPYLSALCASLRNGIMDSERIRLTSDIAPLRMTRDRAIAVGLVVNELTTNALKYAFEGRDNGTIAIRMAVEDGTAVLTIADDGIGYAPEAVRPGGHGIGLVTAFAEQAGGTLERVPVEVGTAFRLTLPL